MHQPDIRFDKPTLAISFGNLVLWPMLTGSFLWPISWHRLLDCHQSSLSSLLWSGFLIYLVWISVQSSIRFWTGSIFHLNVISAFYDQFSLSSWFGSSIMVLVLLVLVLSRVHFPLERDKRLYDQFSMSIWFGSVFKRLFRFSFGSVFKARFDSEQGSFFNLNVISQFYSDQFS